MVYNVTDALGTFGPVARNCYAAGSVGAEQYASYVGNTFYEFWENIRMNVILNYLDFNDLVTSMWTSVPGLDYGQIAFDFSRSVYFILIDGSEEDETDEALILTTMPLHKQRKYLRSLKA